MLIPLRGGAFGLGLTYPLEPLVEAHDDLNRTFEEAWAGLMTVLLEGWPDWPVEVWTRLSSSFNEEGKERWFVQFLVFFAGEGPDNSDVAAMLDFVTRGLRGVIAVPPVVLWTRLAPDCKPLWVIDDAAIYRALAPERGLEPSVYLLGHYAGRPAWFSATVEAWPLHGAGLPIGLVDVDTSWAFST